MDETSLAIRRKAFEDAIAIAETSWTSHNNGTGHHKAAWISARKDIVQMLRDRIELERPEMVREYGMPMLPNPRPEYADR